MKLLTLEETEKQIKEKLEQRIKELDSQFQSIRMLVFDAKLQFKSNEISDAKYESVKTQTVEIIEHIEHEKAEIASIQKRIADLSVESVERTQSPKQELHTAAISYLGKVENTVSQPAQVVAPVSGHAVGNAPQAPTPKPVAIGADGAEDSQDSDWLSRISSQ
jgi:KaiC/GvpD/RAD55 family RecA-like ATPase